MKRNSLLKTSLLGGVLILSIPGVNAQTPTQCFIFDTNTKTITSYSQAVECPREVIIPKQINGVDVEKIGNSAFKNGFIREVSFEGAEDGTSPLTEIGYLGFADNYLEDVVFPSGLKKIDGWGFAGNNFNNIILPEGFEHLEYNAFRTYSPQSIPRGTLSIPSTLTKIGWESFAGYVPSKIEITDPERVYRQTTVFKTDTGLYIESPWDSDETGKSLVTPLVHLLDQNGNIVWPNSVISGDNQEHLLLSYKNFIGNSFNLRGSRPTEGSRAYIAGYYKNGPRRLSGVQTYGYTIDPEYSKRFGVWFENGNLIGSVGERSTLKLTSPNVDGVTDEMTLYISPNITDSNIDSTSPLYNISSYKGKPITVLGSEGLGSMRIDESKVTELFKNLETINVRAFSGNNFKTIVLPANVKYLDNKAFDNNKITSFSWEGHPEGVLPPQRANQGNQIFHKDVVYLPSEDDSYYIFNYFTNFLNQQIADTVNGKPVKEIHSFSANGAYMSNHLKLPSELTTIKEGAFNGNAIETVEVNDKLEVIEPRVFEGNRIKFIHLPATIKRVGSTAFVNNYGLKEVGGKVAGIVPDGTDISLINNDPLSNLHILTQSEYDALNVDLTPPDIRHTVNPTSGKLDITGLDETRNEKALFGVLENYEECPTSVIDAQKLNFKLYFTTTDTFLEEKDRNKKLCILAFDDNQNITTQESTVPGTIDQTAPTLSVNNPSTDKKNSKTYSATTDDPTSAISRTIVNANESCNASLTYTQGDNYIARESDNGKKVCFKAEDPAGNISFKESDIISNIDSTSPIITLDVDNDNQIITPTIGDNDIDSTSLVYYIEGDENNKKPYTLGQPIPLTERMNGKKLIFEASDLVGNKATEESPILRNIDKTTPTLSLNIDDKNQTITPTVSDDNLNPTSLVFYVEGDENNKKPYTNGQSIPLTEDMSGKKVIFEAIDDKGNKTVEEVTLPTIDKTAPTLSLNINEEDQTITPTLGDPNLDPTSLVYYFKDEPTTKIPYTNNKAIPLTENMNGKVLVFEGSDTFGNKVSKEIDAPFTGIDTTPPTITLERNGNTITPSVKDDNLDPSSFEYYIEGTPSIKYPYENNKPVSLTEDMNGKKLVFVAKDLKKNQVTANTDIISGVDRTNPTIDITVDTKGQTVTAVIKDDNLKPETVKYYFKDEPSKKFDYTSNKAIPLTESMNGKTIVFEAEDRDGNKTTKEYPTPFTGIDTTGPNATVSQDGNTVKVTFDKDGKDSSGDTEMKYYFKDENPVTKKDYKEPFNVTSDMDGKTLVIEITDSKGNKTTKEIKLSYKLGGSSPTIPTLKNDNRVTTGGGSGGSGGTSTSTSSSGGSTGTSTTTKTETKPTTSTQTTPKSLLDGITKEAGRTYFEFNGGVYSIKDTSCNYNFTLSQDPTNGFNDVNYVQALTDIITKFKNSGIVSGVGNNNFEPLRGITRAEFLSIILKGNCLDEVIGDKEIPFNDVRRDHWHYNVIKKAYNLGIIAGYGDGTVRPQQEISRIEALAVMMKVNDLRIDKLPDNFLGHKFTDITEEWQNDLLDKVVFFKMVNDEYMKEFKPNKVILRQEVMKFLYDLFNKYVGNGK